MTGDVVRKRYQDRFEKTATHVSELLCRAMDEMLNGSIAEASDCNAIFTFGIADLLISYGTYVLPKGMFEWRGCHTSTPNYEKLVERITALVCEHFADWQSVELCNFDDGDLKKASFRLDAGFKAPVKIYHPAEFDAIFQERRKAMVQYFVNGIRAEIEKNYGTQSSCQKIIIDMEYASNLFLDVKEAHELFRDVQRILLDDKWQITLVPQSGNPDKESLFPKKKYRLCVMAQKSHA